MDNVLTNIKDPSWWFTAFIIAILASVIAGFLKDAISKRLARISSRYRNWRKDTIKRREELVHNLSINGSLIIIEMLRNLVDLILFSISTFTFLSLPVIANVVYKNPEFTSIMLFKGETGFFFVKLLMAAFAILAMFTGFKGAAHASLCRDAYHIYRNKIRQEIAQQSNPRAEINPNRWDKTKRL